MATSFMIESGQSGLTVADLESGRGSPVPFRDGERVPAGALGEVFRDLLRERYWCRLESADAFVHFGWDYYMYLGVPTACPESMRLAERRGLFVEPFRSPYHRREDDSRERDGQDPDRIESGVADLVAGLYTTAELRAALVDIDRALQLRERAVGPDDPSLVWPLSLKIALLGRDDRTEVALQRAALGERRLQLRRVALASVPGEIVNSLRELIGLYHIEYESLDRARCDALEAEARAIEGES